MAQCVKEDIGNALGIAQFGGTCRQRSLGSEERYGKPKR
jgi:hypothetical protein